MPLSPLSLPPHTHTLQHDLGGPVKADDSFWTLDEGELQVQLTKAEEGATWASAIAGAGKHLGCERGAGQRRWQCQLCQSSSAAKCM